LYLSPACVLTFDTEHYVCNTCAVIQTFVL